MTEGPGTVVVIEDDPAICELLEGLLCSVGLQVAVFGSAQEFLRSERPNGPCCLVVDVRLPGQSGLDLQDELVRANDRLPIIFISGYADVAMSVRAMKAGALDFLTKPFRHQDLLDSIQNAITRDRVRCDNEKLLAELQQRFRSLTTREQEVMAFVAAGHRNKQIAADIGASEITVKVHRRHVMQKMAARSVAELVRMADRLGVARTTS